MEENKDAHIFLCFFFVCLGGGRRSGGWSMEENKDAHRNFWHRMEENKDAHFSFSLDFDARTVYSKLTA